MAYIIDKSCFSCGLCQPECPTDSISRGVDQYMINAETCINCKMCAQVCPVDAPRPLEDEFAEGLIL